MRSSEYGSLLKRDAQHYLSYSSFGTETTELQGFDERRKFVLHEEDDIRKADSRKVDIRQSFMSAIDEDNFLSAMKNAEAGQQRRQTVPLQYATEFPDETGQYDELESIMEQPNSYMESSDKPLADLDKRSMFAGLRRESKASKQIEIVDFEDLNPAMGTTFLNIKSQSGI